ncbi:hypothetical protein AVEN_79540-1 [Araneus ventricosus]|uniref:RNase H type-1 domain-containing protein n=1 Tax=Araneus ventricosus TaxID=182803 RepID=A0A4Y2NAW0_ARAVE|nr:hypothetical protein AVEN_79540-1 [Araneus ventricosus]
MTLLENARIRLSWVKAHIIIKGNEITDTLAKEATTDGIPASLPFPKSFLKNQLLLLSLSRWQAKWDNDVSSETSKEYLEDAQFVKDFLISTVENRKTEEENRNIRKEETRRSIEREHKLELARIRATRNDESRSPPPNVTSNGDGDISLDKLIKGVEILTIPVPRKTESWNLFFDSLERAYKHKKVPEEFQAEIVLKLFGDKASNVLVYIKEKDLKDYAKVKALILKEFEPTPQACLENFRKAKRNSGETHIQFVSRLTSTWEYYCKLRKKSNIYIHSKEIKAIIDSGTQISIVHSSLIPDLQDQERSKILLTPAFGGQREAKICRVSIYYKNSGNNLFNNVDTLIAVTDKLNVPCLITPGIYELLVNSADDISHVFDGEINSEQKALTLHSEAKRPETESFSPQQSSEGVGEEEILEQPIKVRRSDVSPSTRTKQEISEVLENADDVTSSTGATRLREEQRSWPSLKEAFLQCKAKRGNYSFIDGLLQHTDKILGQPVTQLVLPQNRRQQVLKLAHESVLGAHMGMRKTKERIRYSFYWPGLSQDVEIFCKTCKECQLRSPEKKTDRIPITPVSRPDLPFQVINVDIIGPIEPPSARKYKYVLCLMDQHSRWPEAVH